ncbi:MAG: glycoside hydrolase family 18 protein [Lachnospirales bacterium]
MKKIILGYVGSKTIVSEDDAKKLTHINTAFGLLKIDGTIKTDHLNIFEQIDKIRKANPNIKICISLVNDTANAFTTCCSDPKLREVFAESCAKLITDFDFDGIDLDWEYPCVPSNGGDTSINDKDNFTKTCKVIRERLNTIPNKKPLFTIAAGADLYYTTCVDLPEVIKYLDYICLMTYDLKCGFHALAGHHTQLYSSTGDIFQNSCDQALQLFHSHGVPKEKLLMGAAFYSRKWENIENRNHGLLQICKNGGGYGPDYQLLFNEYINKNGYKEYWDDEAKAPYLFNGSTFLSYDNPKSLAYKCQYVKEENIGGIFYWEHKCDGTGTLLNTIYENLK